MSPGASSVPAKSEPIITLLAPAAIALTTSPENLTPPSDTIGTPRRFAARAQSNTADTCGTPTPATTRVVQMLPRPDQRFGRPRRRHVARDDVDARVFFFRGAHRVDHALRVTVRRIDHDHV